MKHFFQKIVFFILLLSFVFTSEVHADFYMQGRIYFEQQGILTQATRSFDDTYITKAAFFKIMMENTGFHHDSTKAGIYPVRMKDVPPGSWFAPYVQKAYNFGLFQNKEVYFYPGEPIERIDALKYAMILEGYTIPKFSERTLPYLDLKNAEEKAIATKALDSGIYKPKLQNFFKPHESITRKEAIELLYTFRLIGDSDTELYQNTMIQSDKDLIFKNVQQNIKNVYYKSDDINDDELMQAAIKGYVDAVGNKYTVYWTPKENKEFQEGMSGEFEGIGAYLNTNDDGSIALTPLPSSPAEKAGVQAGDIVKKVNGEDVSFLDSDRLIPIIKGPSGTKVTITFDRDGKEIDIVITRGVVTISSVEAKVEDNILLISIYQFGERSAIEFSDVLEKNYSKELNGIIIDLRNNPGGSLHVVENIMTNFIEEGEPTIYFYYAPSQSNSRNSVTKSIKNQKLLGVKTAILQNKYSASASEILAGTLKDYEAATIFGETSFGKGTMQSVFEYVDGSAIKITRAEWKTGKNTTVEGIGVIPNFLVEDKESTTEDEVMEAAKKWINRKVLP
ncbi:hypothetical protein COB57_04110 [Candidatus Peregrinibacteria bacterium]|nr:MAG: hypothetical protein COB57_04110 [Candidatus Peregrinibacteria bacterium]